jgi:hypothetical protein
MSSKNNVNPDHYKVAGRDRPNETVLGEQAKHRYAQGGDKPGPDDPNFLPGSKPENKVISPDQNPPEGGSAGVEQANEAGKSSSID